MAKLFVVSGLSGAGKDSVIEALKKEKLDFAWVVTTTSRPLRPGESEGHPYHFVSRQQFAKMIVNNELIEWAVVYDNYYGLQKKDLKALLEGGRPVLLKNDYQGARTIQKFFPQTKTIFIIPPSLEVLEKRLRTRAQDSEEAIKRRLAEAKKELATKDQWDYVVVNKEGKIVEAAEEIKKIILKEI